MALALWAAWGDEWALTEKVSFNGTTKIIHVNAGVTALNIRSDVYSAWVRWASRETWADAAMRFSGGDPIPGGETGVTFFLINGWKLVYDPNVVAISGVLYSVDYDTPLWNEAGLPLYPATVSALVNSAVSYQNVVTGTAASPQEIWEYANRALSVAVPTAEQTAAAVRSNLSADLTRLAEAWARLGLDPGNPLVTGQTQVTFGDIVLAMTESAGAVTVTRQ